MVVPIKHTGNFEELKPEEHQDLGLLLARCIKALKIAYSPHGINLGMNLGRAAGAGLESHLHYHLVPRWNGDTNFMPVIANTKVISEMLEDSFTRLKNALKSIDQDETGRP
jgi:ATP adenylyltransferase